MYTDIITFIHCNAGSVENQLLLYIEMLSSCIYRSYTRIIIRLE